MPNEKYYIDRAPIMQFIVDGLNERDPMKNLGYDGIRILTELEFAPKADVVEVVHAKWVEYQVPHIMCCSECGWGTDVQDDFSYCPNCGAKMDLEKQSIIKENKE